MRKVLLSLAAAVAIGACFTTTNANAAPLSPSAIQPSIIETDLTEDVQWRRRRCWHRPYSSRVRCWVGPRPYHYWRRSRWW